MHQFDWDNEPELKAKIMQLYEAGRTPLQISIELAPLSERLTVGVVKGVVKRLQGKGQLRYRTQPQRQASMPPAPQKQPQRLSTYREVVQKRQERLQRTGRFDEMTREEIGLPPIEIAHEQHPDYPEGVNRDAAHRIEHGRTHIFSVTDRARLNVARRYHNIAGLLRAVVAADCPSRAEFDTLKNNEKGLVQLGLQKVLPELKDVIARLEAIGLFVTDGTGPDGE